ncbi:class I SAM-dependent methyltransferase [Plantibacter sp. YIM 135347]|uniref:class I SAM-dependent methyltransferase n=1 Tax=Plantibacter sp. YIM 135347 TaxID=3423919 RepID=UPI003D33160A
MQQSYTRRELDAIVATVSPRTGWDFSRMATRRAAVPWEYEAVVAARIGPGDRVLDVGTGGGERFLSLAPRFVSDIVSGVGVSRGVSDGVFGGVSGGFSGLGIDIDPEMVAIATANGREVPQVSFRQSSEQLETVTEHFDVILNRHAPFSLSAVRDHLAPDGRFITQQVGERNMLNIKGVLGGGRAGERGDAGEGDDAGIRPLPSAPISRSQFEGSGFRLVDFQEYDVEYVVEDAQSLVFWLQALDLLHADVDGSEALADVDAFNAILDGNVIDGVFVTNEHRYLAEAVPLPR